jgi:(R,R)-butanediol dehydrogenase/meso-butanediol dehydrogenase/diacetyl reductase
MGHEISGTVVEIGPDARGVTVGDKIAVEPILRDFDSSHVRRGHYNLGNFRAGEAGLLGFNDDGGFAEFVIIVDYMAHRIPAALSLEEAAIVEPMAVVLRAITESSFTVGDSVAVMGAGPIGLMTATALKAAGAREIFLVDIEPERLRIGAGLGATTIDARHMSAEHLIADHTGGHGVDVVFEAAGVQATLDTALRIAAKGGELVVLSVFATPPTVDLGLVMINEVRIVSTFIYRHNFPQVIDLMATKAIDVRPLITKKIALTDIVSEGFDALTVDKTQAKVLVQPISTSC